MPLERLLMTDTSYTVSALSPIDLDRIRARGYDDFDNPIEIFVNQRDGETPLRCCLRDATKGERVALIAYRPSPRGGPYAEVGPVFVHADRCVGYVDNAVYPEGFRHRRQLFRAYDRAGRQVHNQIVEPAEVDSAIADLLNRADVDFVHSRNVLAGCYMFAVTRESGGSGAPRTSGGTG
jgi:hypothetical protein